MSDTDPKNAVELVGQAAMLPAELELPAGRFSDESLLDSVISGGFLPRVQLFGGNSGAAKEGKIGVGRYGLVRSKDQIEDLTAQFDFMPIDWRFKAMRFTEDNKVFVHYDAKSAEFNKVIQDSDLPNSGCQFGGEFLIWVPNLRCFATFFFASKTARRQAPTLVGILKTRRAATAKVEYIKKGKFAWHGPVITPCSAPFALPDPESIIEEQAKFANPKTSEVEVVDAATEEAAGRER